MTEEIWKDIPEYDGYQVSNLGRVRTHNKVTHSAAYPNRRWKDRIMKGRGENCDTGYRVGLWKDGKHCDYLVARLVAFTFYGEDINNHSLTVNHIDGNRHNNKLDNLELISLADNIRHAFRTGLMPYKQVTLRNKVSGETMLCQSMSDASRKMGKGEGYVGYRIKKGIYSDETFEWSV